MTFKSFLKLCMSTQKKPSIDSSTIVVYIYIVNIIQKSENEYPNITSPMGIIDGYL